MADTDAPGFYTLITRPTDEAATYNQAIGRFITQFSEAEVGLLYVAVSYMKITPFIVGMAAIAPVRVDSGITTIKRVIEARRLRGKSVRELVAVLDQLAVINKARNDLLHYGVGSDQVITTEYVSHHKRLVRRRAFSIEIVRQLIGDIEDIAMYLTCHFMKPDKISRIFRRLHPVGEVPAWRYKYLEPKGNHPKRPGPRRVRATRRIASPRQSRFPHP
jgi:hypothetical protein